jgi:hypothetical protein
LTRNISRRLERLEERAMATTPGPIVFRILLVNSGEGLTGVLVLEDDKPTTKVSPTPEEVERVRVDLKRRRVARLLWKGGAPDTHDCAPA